VIKLSRRKRRWFKAFVPRKWFVTGLILVLVGVLGVLWNEFFLAHSKFVPRSGGIYTEATIGEVQNLNPLSPLSTALDRDIQQLVFAGLLRYDPKQAKVVDGLAELQLLDQEKVYQLKLRPDAKFSDGELVDVADVLFTYETLIKNPGFRNPALRDSFEYIEIAVVDDRTLSFRLPEQNAFFPYLLTTPILPQKYFENSLLEEVLDPDLPYNRRPVGAGPYRIKNMVPEDSGLVRVFFERNPHYYLGEPYLDEVVLYVFSDPERLKLNHDWPVLFSRLPYREVENFQADLFGEYQAKEFYQPRFVGLFFNFDEPIVGNVNFRRGLKQILDLERFLEPDWEPVDSPFFFEHVDGEWAHADADLARETLRDNGFPYNAQLETRTFERQGPPVRIKLVTTTQPPVYSRMAQNIKNTWESELDIEVELLVLPPDELQIALRDRLYDVVLFGQDFSRNLDNLSVWHSSQTGKLNLSNMTRDDVDFIIEEIRFSGAQVDYVQLQDRIDVLIPVIMLATPRQKLLTSPHLRGFEVNWGRIRHLADRFAPVHLWHFQEKRDWDWPIDKSKFLGFLRWLLSGKSPQAQSTQAETDEALTSPVEPEAVPEAIPEDADLEAAIEASTEEDPEEDPEDEDADNEESTDE